VQETLTATIASVAWASHDAVSPGVFVGIELGDLPLRQIALLSCALLWTARLAVRAATRNRSATTDHVGSVESGLYLGGAIGAIFVACLLVVEGLDTAIALSLGLRGESVETRAIHTTPALYHAVGLLVIAFVAQVVTRQRGQVVWLFCSLILAGWWVVLDQAARGDLAAARAVPTGLAAVAGSVSALFVVTQGLIRQHRRQHAWPDRLARLGEGYPVWPGFRPAAAAGGLTVLLLGCLAVTSYLTAPVAAITAAAMFGLAHRQWSPNLGRLGAALVTLAVVAIPMPWFATGSGEVLSDTLPILFNVAVFPLAWMTFHWHWLAGVWVQQLDDGRAWTTAGHMIPVAHRAGFFSGVFGLLATVQMSIWPQNFFATTLDDSPGRWWAGLAAVAALIAAQMVAALMTQKRTIVALMVLTVSVGGLFIAVRLGLLLFPPAR